jgi:hypothetical protein
MDRHTLEKHLSKSESHVATGERNIARQRQIVADLEQDGHDSTTARKILDAFEALQRLLVLDRDRAAGELQHLTRS